MTNAKIKLFIVDRDPIFRLGLRTAIAQYTDFEIVGEGNVNDNTLRELTQGLILNILVIGVSGDRDSSELALKLTQQIQELYPQLPLFLLTPSFSSRQLAKLRSWGIRGGCDRAAGINTIIEGLYTVAYGEIYWQANQTTPKLWQQVLARLSKSGRIELEATLQDIESQLTNPNLSDWERVFLIGRKRELLSVRWLSSRLVAEEIDLNKITPATKLSGAEVMSITPTQLSPLPVFADSNNKTIFERIATDIQLGLNNRTDIPLEIDILQPATGRSLCHQILQRFSETVAQVPIAATLDRDYLDYLNSLWTWSVNNFFTQHYGQLNDSEQQQLADLIVQESTTVQQNIMDEIYGIPQLIEYLLGKPSLVIDNVIYQSDDPEALSRIEFLLHNLVIRLANSVMQMMLNNFYNLEIFKYQLYRSEYRSDRQLARFRNQLSWRYRQEKYFTQPQDIFESRHRLLVLSGGSIRNMYVYASRQAELEALTGIRWLSTIIIEIRDAIAPVVRKIIALTGSGVVFVLTQVVGKGLGLIGKGIIQGIGSSIKDVPHNKKKP